MYILHTRMKIIAMVVNKKSWKMYAYGFQQTRLIDTR